MGATSNGRTHPTAAVVLAGVAAFLNLYSTQPLLPLLRQTFGASTLQAGLTITAPTIAVAIFAPFIGRVADLVGLRRTIVLSAWALTAATAFASTSRTLDQLIVWRFVQGVATPGIFASAVAYIHEVWPATHAGRATAAYMTGTILGGFTGRAVSGVTAAGAAWQLAFVALAMLTGMVAVALTRWLPAEARARTGDGRPPSGGSIAHLFRNRQLLATCGVGFAVLFTQVAMFTYVTFHLAAPPYALGTAALGWLFVVYLVGAIVTPFAGRWIDAYGHRSGIASAMAIGAAGALLTLVSWLPAIVAGLALCATGVFTAQATTSSYIGAVTPRDRALAVGMYSTFYYAGGSTGGALPSILWTAGGWTGCVALVIGVQLAGMAVALTQWSPGTRDAPKGSVPEIGV